MQIPTWVKDVPVTSAELLVAGGALLLLAGFLLGVRRRRRVTLERSYLTDEVIAYLQRIAEALERQAERPSIEQIVEMVQQRMKAGGEEAKLSSQAHTIPYSTFGREYQDQK